METLTIEDIQASVKNLEENYRFSGIELIKSDLLTGQQCIIKTANKIYYSPDMKSGKVKIIDMPELDTNLPPLKFNFFNQSE